MGQSYGVAGALLVSCVLTFVFVLGLFVSNEGTHAQTPIPSKALSYSPHDPIVINGDEDFIPANGVTGGTGIADDPYVIEGWHIDASETTGAKIEGTEAHFIIQDVHIYTADWSSSIGISLWLVDNGVIDNCTFTNVVESVTIAVSSYIIVNNSLLTGQNYAINILGCQEVTLSGNRIEETDYFGVGIHECSNIRVWENNISAMGTAINVYGSSQVDVAGNRLAENWWGGLTIDLCTEMSVHGNEFTSDGITISGNDISHYRSHEITTDNLVNGKPVYYVKDATGVSFDSVPVGQLIFVNSKDITVKDLDINDTDSCIQMVYCSEIQVIDCSLRSATNHGVYVMSSSNIEIASNDISDIMYGGGVYLTGSSHIDVRDNEISDTGKGVYLEYSTEVVIANNTIADQSGWIHYSMGVAVIESLNLTVDSNDVRGFDIGLRGDHATYANFDFARVEFTNNTICDNWVGVEIMQSSFSLFADNWVVGNEYGVRFTGGSENRVIRNNIMNNTNGLVGVATLWLVAYHNNFLNNSIHAQDNVGLANLWDNGYPDGGNYWDNYTGQDSMSGPGQNLSGSDGIGDVAYAIDSDSADKYPLMSLFPSTGSSAISITLYLEKTAYLPDQDVDFVVELVNEGSVTVDLLFPTSQSIDFRVEDSEGGVVFDYSPNVWFWITTLTLEPGGTYSESLTWGQSEDPVPEPGNYTISAFLAGCGSSYLAATATMTIDGEEPATEITVEGEEGEAGWYTSMATVSLGAIDEWSGVNLTNYRVDDSEWSTYSAPFEVSGDGTHLLECYSTDLAGNVENTESVQIKIDCTAPTLVFDLDDGTEFREADLVAGIYVNISWTGSDGCSGLDHFAWQLDNSFGIHDIKKADYLWLFGLDNGTHTLKVYAYDLAGNEFAQSLTFEVIIAEEVDGDDDTSSSTNDYGPYWLLIGIAAVVFAVVVVSLLLMRGRPK